MLVRALLRAVKVSEAQPPYDVLGVKIFYPALAGTLSEREAGILPADTAHAPFPVVIFLPGVNMGAEQYQWLAVALARRGLVMVTMNWIAENLPGRVSLTPGINPAMVTPEAYGTGPSSTALPALLAGLKEVQACGPLAGWLDLTRIVLGGHSAGGAMALMNADRRFFPGVAGAFAYCSNLLATTALGKFPPGVLPPLPSDVPIMLMGATEDGIGNHHNEHFGRSGQRGADTIADTFNKALSGQRGDHYLVILRGANHHTIGHPLDETLGRTYLDLPEQAEGVELRKRIAELIGDFIDAQVSGLPQKQAALAQLMNAEDKLIAEMKVK